MALTLKQVDDTIKEVFDESLVKTVDTVYQKSEDGKYYLLVLSLHALELDDTIIIHTKFIFPCNLEKTGLISNHFSYLANMGCGYKYVEFEQDNQESLKQELQKVLDENKFDDELKDLSEFLSEGPDARINKYLYEKGVEKISAHEVRYNPKFKITPCDESTYDFTININNNYDIDMSIEREDPKSEYSTFNLYFKFNEVVKATAENMENIGEIIAQQLIILFEKEKLI